MIPNRPLTREEQYLDAIARNSGGGGGGSSLPAVTAEDNGDVLGVVDGAWGKMEAPSGLPSCTADDKGYVLAVMTNSSPGEVVPEQTVTFIDEDGPCIARFSNVASFDPSSVLPITIIFDGQRFENLDSLSGSFDWDGHFVTYHIEPGYCSMYMSVERTITVSVLGNIADGTVSPNWLNPGKLPKELPPIEYASAGQVLGLKNVLEEQTIVGEQTVEPEAVSGQSYYEAELWDISYNEYDYTPSWITVIIGNNEVYLSSNGDGTYGDPTLTDDEVYVELDLIYTEGKIRLASNAEVDVEIKANMPTGELEVAWVNLPSST